MFKTISGRRRAKKIIIFVASLAIVVYLLAPVYWVVISSFQKEIELNSRPPNLYPKPGIHTLGHYHYIITGEILPGSTIMLQSMYTLAGTHVLPAIYNSIIISLVVTVVNVLLGFPAGHVFSRFRFWGDRKMMLILLATRLIPTLSIVIPIYILLRMLNMLDTKHSLMALYSAMTLPFTIWIMKSYFQNIPFEFEEAARMDGCGYFRMMLKVVLPLARPGLIAAAIFAFMFSYAEFVLATILTQTTAARTQTAVIAHLSQGMSSSRGMIAAAATLAIVPPLVVAIVFRKQILEGLTARLGIQ